MNIVVFAVAAVAALVLSPSEALAWGPGVHMAVGGKILANLHLLTPFLAELLARRQDAFLYGCLSADIFVGKGTKVRPGHSHNWKVGFDLLESARDDDLKAYAYGYLSHLAADIVAHNLYVPNVLFTTPTSGKLGHVYIEMQADRRVSWDRKLAVQLFCQPNGAADRFLLNVMARKQWPFQLKKRLVRSSLAVVRRKSWGRSLVMAQRAMPIQDNGDYLRRMVDLTGKVVVNFLQRPDRSPALAFDPIGSRRLRQVKDLRRKPGAPRTRLGPVFPDEQVLAALPDVHWD
ncbi:MAG: zinc dependent phospholipase C family protein [Desulfovibrionaceae bacterium]